MSVKKNIFYSVSLNVLNMIFPIVTVPYISRVLGAENVGIVNFTLNYVSYFALLAALGINFYGVRELSKYKNEQEKLSQLFSELFKLVSLSTLASVVIFIVSIFAVPKLQEIRTILLVAGISLYLTPITIDWYFQAKEDFKIITIRSLIIKLLSVAALFLFVRERNDIIPYLLISTMAIVGSQIWNLWYAYKTGLKIKLSGLKVGSHIQPMLVFFGSNIAISIFVILDVLMLGFLSTYEQVGYFTSPNRITALVIAIFSAVNIALLPRLSSNRHSQDIITNNHLLQKAFNTSVFFITPVAVGLCLIASHFVPLFFGKEFLGSITPMRILAFKSIVITLNAFFVYNILFVLALEKKYLIVVCLTATLAFILNLLIIPKYGAIGASITSLFAETFELIIDLYIVYKFTNIRISWQNMLTALLWTLPIIGLYFLLYPIISGSFAFLATFISASIIIYLLTQFFISKNILLIEFYNLLAKKINLKSK